MSDRIHPLADLTAFPTIYDRDEKTDPITLQEKIAIATGLAPGSVGSLTLSERTGQLCIVLDNAPFAFIILTPAMVEVIRALPERKP